MCDQESFAFILYVAVSLLEIPTTSVHFINFLEVLHVLMLMLVSSSVSSKLSLILHAKLGYCSTSPDTGEQ